MTPNASPSVIAYIAIAVIFSLYQAYRGFMFQRLGQFLEDQPVARRIVLLCLADALTYFICTLSGFVALWFFLQSGITGARIPTTAGEATWLIFLAVYSLLGITGKLPEVLSRIHLPGAGHN